jgi:hypothetical protein
MRSSCRISCVAPHLVAPSVRGFRPLLSLQFRRCRYRPKAVAVKCQGEPKRSSGWLLDKWMSEYLNGDWPAFIEHRIEREQTALYGQAA